MPLANPPPPGSPWEPIEAARKKLGWSARKLSRLAIGPKSETHYTQLSTRNWNAEVGTIESFIKALVDAGIPESDLRRRPAGASAGEALREEAAEELIRRGFKMRDAKHAVQWAENEPERDGQRPEVTVERLVAFGAALLSASWDEDSSISHAPKPKKGPPPSSPDPRGTLYSRKRRAGGSK